jgi:putative transposase
MNEWKSAAHVRYNLWYHLVWTPKYRKGILADKATKSLIYRVICEIAERYEFEVRRVAVDDDHVHVFLSAPPRYAPAEIARIIKGITAREVFKVFPAKKKVLWGGELWEDGYAIRSVGDKVSEEIIQRYLERHYKEIGHEPKQLELF